jgi:E1A/CREB-binding protein
MISLIALYSSTSDKISYTCNACRQQCDARYHCTVCKDYDLCTKCYTTIKHEHRMESLDETKTNSQTSINIQQQKQLRIQQMLDAIRHAVQCRETNCVFEKCALCKRLMQHINECTKVSRKECSHCKNFLTFIWFHTKICTDQSCSVSRENFLFNIFDELFWFSYLIVLVLNVKFKDNVQQLCKLIEDV